MRIALRLLGLVSCGYLCVVALAGCVQRRLIYFPTHYDATAAADRAGMTRWQIDGEYAGYVRPRPNPPRVWLFLHGNGGQAGNRGYLLPYINPEDAVYVVEYPGYGERQGAPSKAAFDAAARKAYRALMRQYGVERIIVLGESLGSGPACELAREPVPPKHIVLVVPFDSLRAVAQEKMTFLPVGLLLLDRWDNVEALRNYTGRLDVFGATHDQVIPVEHARNLAALHPGTHYHEFKGDHAWANSVEVDLRAVVAELQR